MGEVTPYGEYGYPGERSPDRIEAEINARHKRLSATLDEIAVRAHPSTVTARAKQQASERVDQTAGRAYAKANQVWTQVNRRVRAEMLDGYGSPRMERVVPAAVVGAALVVGVAVWRRKR